MNENDDAKHSSNIFEIKNNQQEPILYAEFNIEVRKMLLFSKIRHILPAMILLLSLPFFVTSRLTATKISTENFQVNNKEIDRVKTVYSSMQHFSPLECYPTPVGFKPNIFKAIFNIAQPSGITNLRRFTGLLQM